MTWTHERVERLKAMIAEGLGYDDMAVKLGLPRQSVASKAWRIRTGYKNPNGDQSSAHLTSADKAFNERLKGDIEAYWKERGHTVSVCIDGGDFDGDHRYRPHALRSDMVNGLPRRAA